MTTRKRRRRGTSATEAGVAVVLFLGAVLGLSSSDARADIQPDSSPHTHEGIPR